MKNDGTIFFLRKSEVYTDGGKKIESIQSKMAADSGFVYIANDTTPRDGGI
jgi:hypothetical protein